jgi:CheY-like chemotaxis protein
MVKRPKLLLADDSLTIQRVVNLTFADEGIDVVTVGDGDAAMREVAINQPDIVLADVHMPGPSGFEICSMLRGIEETAKIPVILLVGSFEPFDPEEAERAGADAFVTKPFQSIRQLVDQVKELLSREEKSEPAAISISEPQPTGVPPEIDTTDIDSLIQQSFSETTERSHGTYAAEFEADRLDDEMIETSYTADQPNEQLDRETAEANHEMYREADADGAADFDDRAPGAEVIDEQRSPSYEETLQMDAPPSVEETAVADSSLPTAPTEEFRRDPFATTADEFSLNEIDLLDLTPSNSTQEFTFATPAEARQQGSNKQVVSLSPELLDIIVKKVVEKLSEKY